MLSSLSKRYRSLTVQMSIWLLLAGIAGGLTFMVWVASAVKPTHKKLNNEEISTVVDPNILLVNHNPDEMSKLVKPITFEAVIRDKRNYPKEFKDGRFVKKNVGKWTVQVMNVAQHEVITDYLASRSDRDKFNYFRIVDENNQKRFVLTYGVFTTSSEAVGASRIIKFNLPNNVQAFPEEFRLYSSQMDEYEVSEPLQDLRQTPKSVNLSKAKEELAAPKAEEPTEQAKQSIEKSSNSNDTLAIEEGHTKQSSDDKNQENENTVELPIPIPVETKQNDSSESKQNKSSDKPKQQKAEKAQNSEKSEKTQQPEKAQKTEKKPSLDKEKKTEKQQKTEKTQKTANNQE